MAEGACEIHLTIHTLQQSLWDGSLRNHHYLLVCFIDAQKPNLNEWEKWNNFSPAEIDTGW